MEAITQHKIGKILKKIKPEPEYTYNSTVKSQEPVTIPMRRNFLLLIRGGFGLYNRNIECQPRQSCRNALKNCAFRLAL